MNDKHVSRLLRGPMQMLSPSPFALRRVRVLRSPSNTVHIPTALQLKTCVLSTVCFTCFVYSHNKQGLIPYIRLSNRSLNEMNRNSILGAFGKLRKATISCVMSVCLSVHPSVWHNSALPERIFMEFDT